MNRNDWLAATLYHPDDIFQDNPLTNEQVAAMAVEEQPPGWFDPWLVTEQELDDMRAKFDGSSLKWVEYVKVYFPFLDLKKERQLKKDIQKQQDVARCGHKATKLNKRGMMVEYYPTCKHYDLCPRCKAAREKEHFERLMKLDGCPYILGNRKETVAHYHSLGIATYSFKINGEDVTVIETDSEVEGSAGQMCYQVAKEHKGLQVTGTKVSGTAGKEPTEEKSKDAQKVGLLSMRFEASPDTRRKIEEEYLENTKNLTPLTLEQMAEFLLICQKVLFAVINKYCDKIHILGRYFIYITEDDLNWEERPGWIKERLEQLKVVT